MNQVATREDLAEVRAELNGQLSGVRADIKDLTQALRDLIRLDGDIKRMQEAVVRIGREVDDHEDRLRIIEAQQPAAKQATHWVNRAIDWIVFSGVGGFLMYLVMRP